jgi:predicted transcriptional regulator
VARDTIITFKVDKTFKAKLAAIAAAESRSLSNLIEKVLKEEIARREAKRAQKKQTAD